VIYFNSPVPHSELVMRGSQVAQLPRRNHDVRKIKQDAKEIREKGYAYCHYGGSWQAKGYAYAWSTHRYKYDEKNW
jgi:hypothetical protein